MQNDNHKSKKENFETLCGLLYAHMESWKRENVNKMDIQTLQNAYDLIKFRGLSNVIVNPVKCMEIEPHFEGYENAVQGYEIDDFVEKIKNPDEDFGVCIYVDSDNKIRCSKSTNGCENIDAFLELVNNILRAWNSSVYEIVVPTKRHRLFIILNKINNDMKNDKIMIEQIQSYLIEYFKPSVTENDILILPQNNKRIMVINNIYVENSEEREHIVNEVCDYLNKSSAECDELISKQQKVKTLGNTGLLMMPLIHSKSVRPEDKHKLIKYDNNVPYQVEMSFAPTKKTAIKIHSSIHSQVKNQTIITHVQNNNFYGDNISCGVYVKGDVNTDMRSNNDYSINNILLKNNKNEKVEIIKDKPVSNIYCGYDLTAYFNSEELFIGDHKFVRHLMEIKPKWFKHDERVLLQELFPLYKSFYIENREKEKYGKKEPTDKTFGKLTKNHMIFQKTDRKISIDNKKGAGFYINFDFTKVIKQV